MKKFCYLFITILLTTSCLTEKEDPADAFVGTYVIYYDETVTWGRDHKELSGNGMITIEKISSNEVKLSGLLNTTAEISKREMRPKSYVVSDSAGYLEYSCRPVTLYPDNSIIITILIRGKLASYGELYNFYSVRGGVGTKIN